MVKFSRLYKEEESIDKLLSYLDSQNLPYKMKAHEGQVRPSRRGNRGHDA
jgi:hypothetical protein